MSEQSFSFGQFVWWLGKVENIYDPEQRGRYRVRVYGYYSDEIPEEELPWATTVGPIQSASLNGIGYSPTGIQVGTTVIGFFMDGELAQIPVIIGTLYGQGDVNSRATGSRGNKPGMASHGSPKYPHNHVIAGERGIVVEMDNTKDYERFAYEHPKGTWLEIHPDGSQSNHVSGTDRQTVTHDKIVHVGGDLTIKVSGNIRIDVDGDYQLTVGGNYREVINGTKTVHVEGDVTEHTEGNRRTSTRFTETRTAERIYLN